MTHNLVNVLLAVLDGSHVVVAVVSAVAGAVFSYLFLRANPNKKAVVDKEVDKISQEFKR